MTRHDFKEEMMAEKDTGSESQGRRIFVATAELVGTTPYQQGAAFKSPRGGDESPDDWETRCWMERACITDTGYVQLPQMALKLCLQSAASYRGEKIQGRRGKTFTQSFASGIGIYSRVVLDVKKEAIVGTLVYVPAAPASGKKQVARVWKTFPTIEPGWRARAEIIVTDSAITQAVLQRHLTDAGEFIGLGVFSSRVGGLYGKFQAKILSWEEYHQPSVVEFSE